MSFWKRICAASAALFLAFAGVVRADANRWLSLGPVWLGLAGIAAPLPDRPPVELATRWRTHGPATGGFGNLAVDAGRSATLYATTSRGLLRSDDAGVTWISINRSVGAPFQGFAAAPGASGILYAFTGNAVHRTHDSGSTWIPAGEVPGPGRLSGLVVDPVRPETLYAGTFEVFRFNQKLYLYKSVDSGASWTLLPLVGSWLGRLLIDPKNPSFLYAAPGQGYPIERSVDGGLSWAAIDPPGVAGSFDVAADSSNFDTVYAAVIIGGAATGLFVSHDRGDSWKPVNSPPATAVIGIVVDPHRPRTLYAEALPFVVFRSDDGGATWRFVRPGSNVVAFDPFDPQVLYQGGARSDDGGLTWKTLQTGEIASSVWALALARDGSRSVYAAGSGEGGFPAVFRSDDGGGSWIALRTGLPDLPGTLTSIALDPGDPSVLYALSGFSGQAALFKSETKGVVWFRIGAGLPEGGGDLLVDPRNSRTLFARTSVNGVYRSDDGGLTWRASNTGLSTPIYYLAMDPTDSTHLYASGLHQLFRSFDAGATWTAIPVVIVNSPDPSRNSVGPIAIDPVRPWILFSVTSFGILRSTDAGQSWSIVFVPGVFDSDLTAIAIDPVRPRSIYAGTRYGRILHSSDGGDSWRSFDRGFPVSSITTLVVDPENGVLHAGTQGSGVWETPIPADGPVTRVIAPR